jgi:hypothetical protein
MKSNKNAECVTNYLQTNYEFQDINTPTGKQVLNGLETFHPTSYRQQWHTQRKHWLPGQKS